MSSSKTKGEKKRKKKVKKDKGTEKRREAIRATVPQPISPASTSEMSSSDIKSGKLTAVEKKDRTSDRETKFGVELEKRGEDLSISVSHPTQPESITAPEQRDQGDLSLRDRTRKLARRLRRKGKRRR